jgi:agmatine deiminase
MNELEEAKKTQQEEIAAEILQDLFPTRKVVGVDSADLICGFGAIHCISQQQPKGKA